MADAPGQPRPDLAHRHPAETSVGFFELLRRFETAELRFGRAGGARNEPARLGQGIRLSVATGDIAAVHGGAEGAPRHIDVEVLGLFGPEGAMPLHITRWVLERLSERWFAEHAESATADTSFLDFCNLLQHRMIALYWRAWADARPEVQIELGTGGRVMAILGALSGTGLPGLGAAERQLKLRHATALGMAVHGPERLTRFLADIIGAPVALVEFVGRWTEIPPQLHSRLGTAFATLGQSAVIGPRSYMRHDRAELRIGPLDLATYTRILDDAPLAARLRHAIRFAVGAEVAFDLRLVLRRDQVPPARLGHARIGRTAWLPGGAARDADDLRLHSFAGDGTRAAA
jgi:type VI secretion system protein ImpH